MFCRFQSDFKSHVIKNTDLLDVVFCFFFIVLVLYHSFDHALLAIFFYEELEYLADSTKALITQDIIFIILVPVDNRSRSIRLLLLFFFFFFFFFFCLFCGTYNNFSGTKIILVRLDINSISRFNIVLDPLIFPTLDPSGTPYMIIHVPK